MADAVKSYNAAEVTIDLGGIPVDSGFADGTFVKIESAEDAFKSKVGADGMVTRSKTNNRLATVTITLMQTSEINAALSALHNADLLAPNGAGVVPIFIRDRQGTSLYVGSAAWIKKRPAAEFGIEAGTREWAIEVADLVALDGGN